MGLFAKPESVKYTAVQSSAEDERKNTAKAKSRLLETEGKNNGAEVNAEQGRSVRKVFG